MSTSQWIMVAGIFIGVIGVISVASIAWITGSASMGKKALSTGPIVLGFIIGGAGAWKSASDTDEDSSDVSTSGPTVTPSPSPVARPTASVNPPEGGAAPMCHTFSGAAKLVDGYQMVVAVHEETYVRWYFEGAVRWNPDQTEWSSNLTLGEPGDGGKSWQIRPIFLPVNLAQYLISTAEAPGATYWSSPGFPPGTVSGEEITVGRTDEVPC